MCQTLGTLLQPHRPFILRNELGSLCLWALEPGCITYTVSHFCSILALNHIVTQTYLLIFVSCQLDDQWYECRACSCLALHCPLSSIYVNVEHCLWKVPVVMYLLKH
jgi:hypothetical protein